NIAKQVPGKEEFYETLRYFGKQLSLLGVNVKLNTLVQAADLEAYDEVILATGIPPRVPALPGIAHPKVLSYLDVLRDKKTVGKTVAIIGAGGIGFDVAEYLSHSGLSPSLDSKKFFAEWGVDTSYQTVGGLCKPEVETPARQIFLLQRKASKVGDNLGKTTGWIHRTGLKNRRVQMIAGVSYDKVDDAGLHITVAGQQQTIPVDHVILCAGQDPKRDLLAALTGAGKSVHLIGGADVATELDAKRAIDQGARLAASI
ncbi:MAG: FAD-dependent oxidoreductase, partial [Burkholderiales bacterium]|nr:FAD-dependent oxidoreductase [Burkholderiales bacterium]